MKMVAQESCNMEDGGSSDSTGLLHLQPSPTRALSTSSDQTGVIHGIICLGYCYDKQRAHRTFTSLRIQAHLHGFNKESRFSST